MSEIAAAIAVTCEEGKAMLCRNVFLVIGALGTFALAAGCSNDTVGSATAPLVAYCDPDVDPEEEWVCPDTLTVECEDGVGDPESIFFVPEMHGLDDTPCDDITLSLVDDINEAGPFPVQPDPHEIVVTANVEGRDDPVECQTQLYVEDTEEPEVEEKTVELWPPNHKFHTVTGEDCVDVTDRCDEDVEVTFHSATSDEPINDKGDGNTEPDIVFGCDGVMLRAERQGGGNGRVYTLEWTVSDGEPDHDIHGTCIVSVPHDQSGRDAIDDGVAYTMEAPDDLDCEDDDGDGSCECESCECMACDCDDEQMCGCEQCECTGCECDE